jgi:hypothetical protein
MFRSLSQSWEFSKMSYKLIGQHKHLLIFPMVSSLAAALVTISFILPLWQTGQLAEWLTFLDEETATSADPMMYVTAFLFYFCNYFAIVFFNSGLVACVMRIMNGQEAPVSYGMGVALKRLPQIAGWALVSAVVGVILKAIENSHKKAGRLISALFGAAWTAVTYFVIPVVVVDGVGPVEAFKRSTGTLKSTWGTALSGNFSMGFLSFLVMLPVVLVLFALGALMASLQSPIGLAAVVVLGVALLVVAMAVTGAADMVFKTFLYAHATGKSIPAEIDTSRFDDAFRKR